MEETAIMKAEATLKYARISARKVKIVADLCDSCAKRSRMSVNNLRF